MPSFNAPQRRQRELCCKAIASSLLFTLLMLLEHSGEVHGVHHNSNEDTALSMTNHDHYLRSTTTDQEQEVRVANRWQRRLTDLPDWMCSLFGDLVDGICQGDNTTTNTTQEDEGVQCAQVLPLSNQTGVFDLDNFTEKTWFVQKQQPNGFQYNPEDDFYCLAWTYTKRVNETFYDFVNYGTTGGVDGPQQDYDEGSSDALEGWCAGQDEDGGGLLRISPCILRPLLVRVGFPQWVLAVAEDYAWAIVSGGEIDEIKQTDPTTLCTTRTNVSEDVLVDTAGSGLWLLTRERKASTETISRMEQTLLDMGIYTGDLLPIVQDGCNYTNATLIE